MEYKAIVCDIDGTITSKMHSGNLHPLASQKIVETFKKAQEKIHIVLATSRPLVKTTYLLDQLKLSCPCITLNGGLIIDAKSKRVLKEHPISLENLSNVTDYLQKKKLSFIIDERDRADIPFSKNYVPNHPLNIFVSELTEKQAKKVENDLSSISTIAFHKVTSWTVTKWGFNISNATVSKQHAILEVAEMLGIETHEMIGVGDGYNDFPLLMACGFKVAMGNAVNELKEIADYVAPCVEEDGVADVIEKFILNP